MYLYHSLQHLLSHSKQGNNIGQCSDYDTIQTYHYNSCDLSMEIMINHINHNCCTQKTFFSICLLGVHECNTISFETKQVAYMHTNQSLIYMVTKLTNSIKKYTDLCCPIPNPVKPSWDYTWENHPCSTHQTVILSIRHINTWLGTGLHKQEVDHRRMTLLILDNVTITPSGHIPHKMMHLLAAGLQE